MQMLLRFRLGFTSGNTYNQVIEYKKCIWQYYPVFVFLAFYDSSSTTAFSCRPKSIEIVYLSAAYLFYLQALFFFTYFVYGCRFYIRVQCFAVRHLGHHAKRDKITCWLSCESDFILKWRNAFNFHPIVTTAPSDQKIPRGFIITHEIRKDSISDTLVHSFSAQRTKDNVLGEQRQKAQKLLHPYP